MAQIRDVPLYISVLHCVLMYVGLSLVAMVNLERKFDILHHSIANFTRWIDSSTSLLKTLSDSQTGLESGQQGKDDSKLRDLALQYKVITYMYIHKLHVLYSAIL